MTSLPLKTITYGGSGLLLFALKKHNRINEIAAKIKKK